jgi:hypothetical protein
VACMHDYAPFFTDSTVTLAVDATVGPDLGSHVKGKDKSARLGCAQPKSGVPSLASLCERCKAWQVAYRAKKHKQAWLAHCKLQAASDNSVTLWSLPPRPSACCFGADGRRTMCAHPDCDDRLAGIDCRL